MPLDHVTFARRAASGESADVTAAVQAALATLVCTLCWRKSPSICMHAR